MDRAVQKTLAAVSGRVLKTELEDENGFLVYGVEVVTPDRTVMDVKVDAGSGKVLAIEQDPARIAMTGDQRVATTWMKRTTAAVRLP